MPSIVDGQGEEERCEPGPEDLGGRRVFCGRNPSRAVAPELTKPTEDWLHGHAPASVRGCPQRSFCRSSSKKLRLWSKRTSSTAPRPRATCTSEPASSDVVT